KMHGIGNDYVYVNGFEEKVANPPALAKVVADRHFGIGSDGLILILPSDKADVRMRIFNADGSEGEMCGNGIRCVAKYAYDHGLSRANPLRIETGRGVLSLDLKTNGSGKVELVTVNMGQPVFDLAKIPADPAHLRELTPPVCESSPYAIIAESGEVLAADATVLSTGNPHVVIFVDDVSIVDVTR